MKKIIAAAHKSLPHASSAPNFPLSFPRLGRRTHFRHTMSESALPSRSIPDTFAKGEIPTENLGWIQRIREGKPSGSVSIIVPNVIPDPLHTHLQTLQQTIGDKQVHIHRQQMHITVGAIVGDSDDHSALSNARITGPKRISNPALFVPFQLRASEVCMTANWDIILKWEPVMGEISSRDPLQDIIPPISRLRAKLRAEGEGLAKTPETIHTTITYAWDRKALHDNQVHITAALHEINTWIRENQVVITCDQLAILSYHISPEIAQSLDHFRLHWNSRPITHGPQVLSDQSAQPPRQFGINLTFVRA